MRPRRIALLAAALATAGCGGPSRVARLNSFAAHVHVHPNGWYDVRSDDGYRFALPGIPSVRQVHLDGPGGGVDGLRYELRAEGNSRGFYLMVFELGGHDRGAVLEALTRSLVPEGGSISERHTIDHGGVPAEQVHVENVTRNQHSLMARSFAHGDRVFQAVAIMAPASGLPRDVQIFLDSLEVRGPPEAPR